MNPIDKRVKAAQTTLDRFKDQPFKFGKNDCGRMVAFHLRAIGKPIKTAKAGTYHSLLGATKALKRLGFDNLVDLMDAHFERIPPAASLPGDIIAMPGLEGPGALTVVLGEGRVVGYHEEMPGAVVMQPVEMMAAWRVPVA